MGEVVSSEETVCVPGLMPALLPRNYFSSKLFRHSDAVWDLKELYLPPPIGVPSVNPGPFISLLHRQKKTVHGQLDKGNKAFGIRERVVMQVYAGYPLCIGD